MMIYTELAYIKKDLGFLLVINTVINIEIFVRFTRNTVNNYFPRKLFKNKSTTRHIDVEGDIIYDGMPILINLGLGMIGNNPNAVSNKSNLSILEAHSEANQNIINLKFVYKLKDNGEKNEKWLDTEDTLKNTHPKVVRKFNEINKNK
ncbi:hypothetical protein ACLSZW_03970 [Avibacterium avium]|uniref:hypothetical protein n=2 Tax=Avibacterium avium TaxID=751 RepID=UPI003BF7C3E7